MKLQKKYTHTTAYTYSGGVFVRRREGLVCRHFCVNCPTGTGWRPCLTPWSVTSGKTPGTTVTKIFASSCPATDGPRLNVGVLIR
jgi:hypothetical protein